MTTRDLRPDSTNDDILDRIDSVLGPDAAIGDDYAVSGDAMRSRPPAPHDVEYDSAAAHRTPRTITVNLMAEISAFHAAFARLGEVMRRTPQNCRCIVDDSFDLDLEQSIAFIRDVVADEKSTALDWWDTHLDGVYASLGLTRDPNIVRGDS